MHPPDVADTYTTVTYILVRSEKAERECHFTNEFYKIEKCVTNLLITLANSSLEETFRFQF
jgi:hypothetical protein